MTLFPTYHQMSGVYSSTSKTRGLGGVVQLSLVAVAQRSLVVGRVLMDTRRAKLMSGAVKAPMIWRELCGSLT
jgi:hypothetical protein